MVPMELQQRLVLSSRRILHKGYSALIRYWREKGTRASFSAPKKCGQMDVGLVKEQETGGA